MLLVAGLFLTTFAGRVDAAEQDRWTQLASPVFRHYGSDDGLPNPVIAMAESADGFLWLGTEAGLARWDGYHFKIYRPVPGDVGALPDNVITALYADSGGHLWIGTNTGGLARYDRDRDRFVTYAAGTKGSATHTSGQSRVTARRACGLRPKAASTTLIPHPERSRRCIAGRAIPEVCRTTGSTPYFKTEAVSYGSERRAASSRE